MDAAEVLKPVMNQEVVQQMDQCKVYAYGKNPCGQISFMNEEENCLDYFKQVVFKTHISQITCGMDHTHILTRQNRVYSIGSNEYGQLGIGSQAQNVREPTLISHHKFKKILCADNFSIALDQNQQIYAWGQDDSGAIGPMLFESKNKCVPHKLVFKNLDKFHKIRDFACSSSHSCFITNSGDVFTCG